MVSVPFEEYDSVFKQLYPNGNSVYGPAGWGNLTPVIQNRVMLNMLGAGAIWSGESSRINNDTPDTQVVAW